MIAVVQVQQLLLPGVVRYGLQLLPVGLVRPLDVLEPVDFSRGRCLVAEKPSLPNVIRITFSEGGTGAACENPPESTMPP